MFKNLKKGEVLSETQFYTVEKVVGNNVELKTDSGESVIVSDKYVDEFLNSSLQYDKITKVTRTELTDIFLANPRVAMTVNFNKQVKPTDIKNEIYKLYPNKGKIVSETAFKAAINKALDLKGEERTMIGRHYANQDVNGRISFVDMEQPKTDLPYDSRTRLVDPRTLNWLIVNKIKYEVK